MSVGRDDGLCTSLTFGNLVFLGLFFVIAQEHTLHINRLVGGVIKLHPVVTFEVIVDIDAVGSTHLVDSYGCDAFSCLFLVGKWGKASNK